MKIEKILLAKLCLLAVLACPFTSSLNAIGINDVWINEFHYDNISTDSGEFVEIAGIAGIDLTGLTLELYNGSNGTVYDTINLSGTLANSSNGYGFLSFAASGLQNGAPDGIALKVGSEVQFISYEGSFAAVEGEANGIISTDIGVSEQPVPAAGLSLQFLGHGWSGSWTGPIAATPGTINVDQVLPNLESVSNPNTTAAPDSGTTLGLLSLSFALLITIKRRHH